MLDLGSETEGGQGGQRAEEEEVRLPPRVQEIRLQPVNHADTGTLLRGNKINKTFKLFISTETFSILRYCRVSGLNINSYT